MIRIIGNGGAPHLLPLRPDGVAVHEGQRDSGPALQFGRIHELGRIRRAAGYETDRPRVDGGKVHDVGAEAEISVAGWTYRTVQVNDKLPPLAVALVLRVVLLGAHALHQHEVVALFDLPHRDVEDVLAVGVVPNDEVAVEADLHGLRGGSGPKVDVAPLPPGVAWFVPFRTDRQTVVENESRGLALM